MGISEGPSAVKPALEVKRGEGMANTKTIFIAFAIEDERQRDFLKGQSLHPRAPFEFIDMSVKEPYRFRLESSRSHENSPVERCHCAREQELPVVERSAVGDPVREGRRRANPRDLGVFRRPHKSRRRLDCRLE